MKAKSIKTWLNQLHSVLNIPENLDIPVRLLHLSFRDFLLDNMIKDTENSEQFWIDEKSVHQSLTDQCLEVMWHNLRKNICNLPGDGTQRSEIDIYSVNLHLPPGLRYACRYRTQHLIHSQDPLAMLVNTFSFLRVHFLHWIEVVSVLGILSEVVEVIKRLESVIQVSYRNLLHT
jgi:hypothetical protein